MYFDLLTTVESGGCSAKLPAAKLSEALRGLPKSNDPNLLVDIETHDDAGVYKITNDIALIQTTDFFPPVCSDPFEFGQIAAANALSDVYAMGGQVLTCLNIVMFPTSRIPLSVLTEILRGGQSKVAEANSIIVGGHTIDDYPPKYGLSVTGIVHPERIITNAAARPGQVLILSKPIGTGVLISGQRIGEAKEGDYREALESMKLLNQKGSTIMQHFGVRSATDITGFGLLGHALKMAQGSDVTMQINGNDVPLLPGVHDLAEIGCIPGACFRNQEFVETSCRFNSDLDYTRKMVLFDAQTSGGLLMAVAENKAQEIVSALRQNGYPQSAIIGSVIDKAKESILVS